jgi:NhaP-type Na+/H+ or K+/H+ antiporter
VESAHPALTLVLALAAGVLAQAVARHLRLPGIVLLLGAGAALGPDGFGWVRPNDLGEGLLMLVELSVAVILFEGGLNLEIRRLRREGGAIRRLVLGGALVTMVGGAAAVHWLLDWDWMGALVFGSLIVVTGPTVIGPLVQELRLRPRVATVLEAEGVLIDPVGAILAVLMLEVALAPGADSVWSGTRELLTQVGFGAVMGAIGGFAIASLLRVRRLIPEGYENIVVLASVLLLFQICNEVAAPSGLLAAPIAGVVVGNLRSSVDRDLREFKDQLTVLLIGMLFILLAASVRIEDVMNLGWHGLAVVGALIFLVRPLSVWLATVGTELDWRERLLVAWLAPRGIVAAAVASATAVALERAGAGRGPGAAGARLPDHRLHGGAGRAHRATGGQPAAPAPARARRLCDPGRRRVGLPAGGRAAERRRRRGLHRLQPAELPPCPGRGLHRRVWQRPPGTHPPAFAHRHRWDRGGPDTEPDAEQRVREPRTGALLGPARVRSRRSAGSGAGP